MLLVVPERKKLLEKLFIFIQKASQFIVEHCDGIILEGKLSKEVSSGILARF